MGFGDCSGCLEYKYLTKAGRCLDCSFTVTISHVLATAYVGNSVLKDKITDGNRNSRIGDSVILLNEVRPGSFTPSIYEDKLMCRERSVSTVKEQQENVVEYLEDAFNIFVSVTNFEICNVIGTCQFHGDVRAGNEDDLKEVFDRDDNPFSRTGVEPGKRTVRRDGYDGSYTICDEYITFAGGTDIEQIKKDVEKIYLILSENDLLVRGP